MWLCIESILIVLDIVYIIGSGMNLHGWLWDMSMDYRLLCDEYIRMVLGWIYVAMRVYVNVLFYSIIIIHRYTNTSFTRPCTREV